MFIGQFKMKKIGPSNNLNTLTSNKKTLMIKSCGQNTKCKIYNPLLVGTPNGLILKLFSGSNKV